MNEWLKSILNFNFKSSLLKNLQCRNPQRQSPMDAPLLSQTEFVNHGHAYQIPNEAYREHIPFQEMHPYPIPIEAYRSERIPFQEMHPYYLNVNKSIYKRRNRRFELRRNFRCKEERPYRCHDKTFTHNNCNYKRFEKLPPQAKDENRTQFSEEGLMFLLQKKLQSSDVSSLGRIVLPKRDAEAYLPNLVTQEGILISVQDRENNITWHLTYRYFPNNKTRIYVLENTGNFVRTHGLQKGDFIMLYQDEHDNFVIKGRKATELDLSKPYTINSEPNVEEIEYLIGKISLVDSLDGSRDINISENIDEMIKVLSKIRVADHCDMYI